MKLRYRILIPLTALVLIVGTVMATTGHQQQHRQPAPQATCAWIWALHGWIYYCWNPGGGGGGSW
jgi:uncharacterized membrane protein YozB (DUF420 family)